MSLLNYSSVFSNNRLDDPYQRYNISDELTLRHQEQNHRNIDHNLGDQDNLEPRFCLKDIPCFECLAQTLKFTVDRMRSVANQPVDTTVYWTDSVCYQCGPCVGVYCATGSCPAATAAECCWLTYLCCKD